ncbi:hypothetical protein [Marilutibacter aestuarii]|uniref:Uncharacterized protein n=1 Tax=Marilutibacter aestuarii TaxID=1706195 RepID=A0A507ZYT3_9GAMM|nr:hypothetical protein [Lysobacter aestuarii]TQD41741.1 hypothetical protein FKV25_12625 [Lysobacter aestuarii]
MPPPVPPVPAAHAPRVRPPAWLLLVFSATVLVVMWVLLSLYTGRQHAWMALVAGLDVAWVLRFGGWRRGIGRAALAAAATAAVAAAAQWGIIAGHIGSQMGLAPFESSLKLGLHHAWFMATLANDPLDWSLMGLGLLLAFLASR